MFIYLKLYQLLQSVEIFAVTTVPLLTLDFYRKFLDKVD